MSGALPRKKIYIVTKYAYEWIFKFLKYIYVHGTIIQMIRIVRINSHFKLVQRILIFKKISLKFTIKLEWNLILSDDFYHEKKWNIIFSFLTHENTSSTIAECYCSSKIQNLSKSTFLLAIAQKMV